jgi:hypothetical protein
MFKRLFLIVFGCNIREDGCGHKSLRPHPTLSIHKIQSFHKYFLFSVSPSLCPSPWSKETNKTTESAMMKTASFCLAHTQNTRAAPPPPYSNNNRRRRGQIIPWWRAITSAQSDAHFKHFLRCAREIRCWCANGVSLWDIFYVFVFCVSIIFKDFCICLTFLHSLNKIRLLHILFFGFFLH